jgi:hypothetical protein
MASNGTAPVIPASGVQEEQGSALDRDRLFLDYGDGRIFTPYDVGSRQIDTMLKSDGKARSLEQALTLPLRSASFSIEPDKGDAGEAEWLNETLTRNANAGGMSTPLELVISQAVSACLYRRSFFEKVFKLDDAARIVYDKVAFRPAGTCRLLFDENTGSFNGFSQRVPTDHPKADADGRVTIKPQRAFVFVYGQHRRPIEGVSDLETVYGLFETKQKIKFLWASFLENQVMPKAIASDTSGNTEANKLARKVATLKGGGVVGINGETQKVEAFETSIAAAQAFADAIRFLDGEMSASVLAGFLDLASAASLGRGSYALSESQSDFFLQSRQAVLTELAAAIENYLIADLIKWNFGPSAVVPRFKFGSLRAGDLQTSVALLQAIAGSAQTMIPREFIDELTVSVAGALNLNVDKVSAAIRDAQAQAPQNPLGQVQAGVDVATQLLQSLPQAA